MYYADLRKYDTSNWSGINSTLFVSGCEHCCEGCWNKEAWNFKYGKPYTKEVEDLFMSYIKDEHVVGACILGGEPLCEENLFTTAYILRSVREQYDNSIEIYLWTGYTLQELKDRNSNAINGILEDLDYLIDGRFVEELKNPNLELRGSSNQTIHCLKK